MEARTPRRILLLAVACLALTCAGLLDASAEERPIRRSEPHIGYAFPAGGQVGTTFRVVVGGQFLRGARGVRVSGEGVTAKVVYWFPPPRPLNDTNQRRLLQQKLFDRAKELGVTGLEGVARRRPRAPSADAKLPNHPLLKDLESKNIEELQEVVRYFFRRRNPLQRKRAIEESVKLDVTIAPDAEPGLRDFRLITRAGISNPLRFRVGLVPEVREKEPLREPDKAVTAAAALPAVFNGQIQPRDVDRFSFPARKGQRLVARAEARALIPYQADSVPGWMQATLALFDPQGQEVAYADEYRFDPDPVLFYEVPADGDYVLEVRDAVARGRDDFVYRVTVGELPFITRMFPLGGREGELVHAAVAGWNLEWGRVPLDTHEGACLREATWRKGETVTNAVAYEVDTLPEETEPEPNDDRAHARPLDLPCIINGRIEKAGDVDVYRFEGKRGDEVVAEVCARALGSPLDSVLRLTRLSGEVVAWNDDCAQEGLGVRGLGLQTHHADSYLRAKLPESGTYLVRVADVRGHGGEDFAYRLRVGAPRPDVELFVTPSSVNLPIGRASVVSVRAVRKDGYDGDIEIVLRDAPPGFELGGARIRAGRDSARMTLTPPRLGAREPVALQLAGRIHVGRETLERPVVPADDMMQAFLWRHLVPAQEFVVTVLGRGGRWVPRVALAEDEPVRIARGGKATVRFDVGGRLPADQVSFGLLEGPKGVAIGEAKAIAGGFDLEIRASPEAEEMKVADNLIVEVFAERLVPVRGPGKDGKPRREKRKASLGFLPAIPYRVVGR